MTQKLKGLITSPSAAMEAARAMRAELAGHPREAAQILEASRERSRIDAARYARDVTRIDTPDE